MSAVLSANGPEWPICRTTAPTVASGSRSRSAAGASRQPVNNAIDGSPTSLLNRWASSARDTPAAHLAAAREHFQAARV